MTNLDTKGIASQTDRVVVITGSNSGIGFETARALAAKEATVIMAVRNPQKAMDAIAEIRREFPHSKVEAMALDLSDLHSVRAFGDSFNQRFSRLDLLINNAGVMAPPFTKTPQGFELTFATNHLGPFALTALLLAKLNATPGARVVTVSSLAHRSGKIDFDNLNAERRYSKAQSYAQSKLANLLFTMELGRRLRSTGQSTVAVAVHPGWTITNLQVNTKIVTFLNPFLGQTPAEGALPSLYAATNADVQSGDYFGPSGFMELHGAPRRVNMIAAARDEATASRLWQVSEFLIERSGALA